MTELEKFEAESLRAKKALDCMNKEEEMELFRLRTIVLALRDYYMKESKNLWKDYVTRQIVLKEKAKAREIYVNYHNMLKNKYN